MEAHLSSLEAKITQVVSACQNLRSENQDLRTRVVALEDENRRLQQKMDDARARLEALVAQIPEVAE